MLRFLTVLLFIVTISARAGDKKLEVPKEAKEAISKAKGAAEDAVEAVEEPNAPLSKTGFRGSFGLYIDRGIFQLHDPADDASVEDKAYMNSFEGKLNHGFGGGIVVNLPSTTSVMNLPAFGFGIKKSHQYSAALSTSVDIKGTPSDTSDDVTLKKVTRDYLEGVIFMYAIKYLTVGIGWEDGKMEYQIKDENGVNKTVKKDYAYPYLHLCISTSRMFPKGRGLFFAATASVSARSVSTRHGRFSGDTYSASAGWMF